MMLCVFWTRPVVGASGSPLVEPTVILIRPVIQNFAGKIILGRKAEIIKVKEKKVFKNFSRFFLRDFEDSKSPEMAIFVILKGIIVFLC